jgi:hypothetical protein
VVDDRPVVLDHNPVDHQAQDLLLGLERVVIQCFSYPPRAGSIPRVQLALLDASRGNRRGEGPFEAELAGDSLDLPKRFRLLSKATAPFNAA